MIQIPQPNPVEFLIERKFPDARKLQRPVPVRRSGGRSGANESEYRIKRLVEIAAYKDELLAMPAEKLRELFEDENEIINRVNVMPRLADVLADHRAAGHDQAGDRFSLAMAIGVLVIRGSD